MVLQLHLSDQQFYSLLRCNLYWRFDDIQILDFIVSRSRVFLLQCYVLSINQLLLYKENFQSPWRCCPAWMLRLCVSSLAACLDAEAVMCPQ